MQFMQQYVQKSNTTTFPVKSCRIARENYYPSSSNYDSELLIIMSDMENIITAVMLLQKYGIEAQSEPS